MTGFWYHLFSFVQSTRHIGYQEKKGSVISSTNSAAASMIIETDPHIGIASTQLPLPLSL